MIIVGKYFFMLLVEFHHELQEGFVPCSWTCFQCLSPLLSGSGVGWIKRHQFFTSSSCPHWIRNKRSCNCRSTGNSWLNWWIVPLCSIEPIGESTTAVPTAPTSAKVSTWWEFERKVEKNQKRAPCAVAQFLIFLNLLHKIDRSHLNL